MSTTAVALGETSITLICSGSVCETPCRVTLTSVIGPVIPLTVTADG